MSITIIKSDEFDRWLSKIKDNKAFVAIQKRLRRVALGNIGDVKHIKDGIYEMRIFEGKGYRLYYFQEGEKVVFLLCGGHKGTQKKDIEKAIRLKETYDEQ